MARMKYFMCSLISVIFLLFSGQLYAQQEREMFVKEYKIGPKDLLEIKVFELPELNQTVRVSEDGTITLPLLQSIKIEGLTKDEVERKLAALLEEKYVRNAQVSVFIKEYQSNRVSVIGAVEKQGMYELIGKQNLIQIISQAGGLKENASDEIFVLREGKNGIAANIKIDLEELFTNNNQKLNIPIQPNDIINVPIDKLIHIYVYGEVKSPGVLQVKMSKRITLLQAVAMAGGLTEGASKSRVTLKRRDKTGKETSLKVNLKNISNGKKPDIVLKEGDVIYVPASIF